MKTRSLVFSVVALAFACGGNVSTERDGSSGGSGGNSAGASGGNSGGKGGVGPGGVGGVGGKGGAYGRGGQSGASGTGGSIACTPRETASCVCADGIYGVQVCLPDGSGFGGCECAGGGGAGGCGSFEQCAAQSPWLGPECTACSCSVCLCEMNDCLNDPGCTQIAQCASKTGCSGVACYSPQTCQFVIDSNGGPTGIAAGLANYLGSCIVGAGCPCSSFGSGGAAGGPTACKCDGVSTMICDDGTAVNCVPFRCNPGGCFASCASNAECAPGYGCVEGKCFILL